MTRVNGRCDCCGTRGPVLAVHYRQNTGMLFMRQTKELEATVCRACSVANFTRMTLHTAVFGWWGMISFVLTPIFLFGNIHHWVRTLSLPSAESATKSALADQREYALTLLATKDRATVVEVIAKASGASRPEVEAFLSSLGPRDG